MKKLLSMLLAITMLVSMMVVVPASAETTDDNVLKLIEFTPECDKVTYGSRFADPRPAVQFTTDKVRVGNYSAHYVGGAADGVHYFQYIVDVEYNGIWNDEDYLKMWVYNAGDECALTHTGTSTWGIAKPQVQLNAGWNLVSIRLGMEGYADTNIPYTDIFFDGYVNGVSTTSGKNLDLYFGEPWIEKTDTYDTLTATPSVADGATDVDTQLAEYTINFSNPLNDPEKAASAVTLKLGDKEVEKAVITGGADFVKIVPGGLLPGATYTVSIADEALFDITGNEPNTKSFTFTTAEASETIIPTLTVLSPASGSTASNPTTITIGVESGDHVASVKVFDDKNELGEAGIEAVNSVGNEWQVDAVTFTEGAHTITAKAYAANGEELATVAATFTTVAVGPFNVSGIYEGAYHALNEKTTVKVTTEASANDIAKVVFVDGETEAVVTEAPFEWNLPKIGPGAHTLKVYVHDIYGGETLAKTINYTSFMGDPIATVSQNFEGVAPTITTSPVTNTYSVVDCANLDGKALKVTGQTEDMFINPGTQIGWNGDIKVIYQEFDVYHNNRYGGITVKYGYPGYAHGHGYNALITDEMVGERTHIRIIYDIVNKKYSVYQGDTIISEGTEFSYNMVFWNDTNKQDFCYALTMNNQFNADSPVYFDNFKTTAYSELDTANPVIPELAILSPVNGSKVENPAKITIAVENGSHVAGVKIVDDKNELGEAGIEAVKGVDNEWQVDAVTLTEGEHTITAIAYDAFGNELDTAVSTFTTVQVGPFNVSGIYEGANIALNEKTTVKVTTEAAENDIEKVVFVDGETETTDADAPYEWSLPNNPGAHTLKVYVHDIYGGERLAKTISYTTFMGNAIATVSQDFEGAAPTITTSPVTDTYSVVDCANLDGKALKVTGETEDMFINPGTQIGWNGDIKVIYQEFDVYHNNQYGGITVKFGYPEYAHGHGYKALITDEMVGERTHIRIIYDIVNKKYSVYQGDTIISEGTEFSYNMMFWNDTNKKDFSYAFTMSDKFTAESPVYFDNFKTVAYSDLGAGEVAAKWDNPTIIENNQATSIPTSMRVVNTTGATLSLINIFAEYTPAGVLVNAYVDEFDAPTGQKTESEYVMTGLTAGNTVKMYTLDAETLKPYTVPSK